MTSTHFSEMLIKTKCVSYLETGCQRQGTNDSAKQSKHELKLPCVFVFIFLIFLVRVTWRKIVFLFLLLWFFFNVDVRIAARLSLFVRSQMASRHSAVSACSNERGCEQRRWRSAADCPSVGDQRGQCQRRGSSQQQQTAATDSSHRQQQQLQEDIINICDCAGRHVSTSQLKRYNVE